MRTVKKIESNLDGFVFGMWSEDGEIETDFGKISKSFGITVSFVEFLDDQFSMLRDSLKDDLADIWKRLDEALGE